MSAETILNNLDTSIACLTEFNRLLDIEYDLLQKRNGDAIEAVIQEKHEKLLKLESTLGIHGKQPIELESYVYMQGNVKIGVLPAKHQQLLREKWQTLLSSIRICQLSNQRNGQFVNLAHQNTLQALAILRGQTDSAPHHDYSPDGNNQGPTRQRSIAKA